MSSSFAAGSICNSHSHFGLVSGSESLTYQRRLSGALYATDPKEERGRIEVFSVSDLVHLQSLKEERNTVFGLVVDYPGHVALLCSPVF